MHLYRVFATTVCKIVGENILNNPILKNIKHISSFCHSSHFDIYSSCLTERNVGFVICHTPSSDSSAWFVLLSKCLFFVQHIEPWLSSGHDHERERAVTATADMLAFYLDNLTVKVHAQTVYAYIHDCFTILIFLHTIAVVFILILLSPLAHFISFTY